MRDAESFFFRHGNGSIFITKPNRVVILSQFALADVPVADEVSPTRFSNADAYSFDEVFFSEAQILSEFFFEC